SARLRRRAHPRLAARSSAHAKSFSTFKTPEGAESPQMPEGVESPLRTELVGISRLEHRGHFGDIIMPRGDKSSYTDKQKRQAEHIEKGYEGRGIRTKEAERRAWATVNKEPHGGKKSGSGRGKKVDRSSSRKGGHLGGAAAAKRPAAARSRSAKKAAQTRKRRAG